MVTVINKIPRRGQLIFKQYIPGKSSKNGVKLFKLYISKGDIYMYIYYLIFYGSKMTEVAAGNDNGASNVILKVLMKYYTRLALHNCDRQLLQ